MAEFIQDKAYIKQVQVHGVPFNKFNNIELRLTGHKILSLLLICFAGTNFYKLGIFHLNYRSTYIVAKNIVGKMSVL